MIKLTRTAAEQIHQAAVDSGAEKSGLRVAAKVNEAGMVEFGMGFDEERSNDSIVESFGVTLLVHPSSIDLLRDITIDFAEVTPGDKRFVFMLPERETSEGGSCGSGNGSGGGGCGSGGCGSGSCA